MPRLGVIGTMVWDRIYARDVRAEPVEEWGGITYALAALAALRPHGWEVVPMVKVGRDLEPQARRFLDALPGLDPRPGVRFVPEPNNRVELRYQDQDRRCERLTGGVPAWNWSELAPIVQRLDALYVNFISGFELGLEAATQLRLAFAGPIYADLHSLLLGVAPGGMRVPQPLAAWKEWLRCFDVVQVNEDELALLAHFWGDPWVFAAEVVGQDLRVLLVTLGPRGAAYVASPAFQPDPCAWRSSGLAASRPLGAPGPATSECIPLENGGPREGDPTGCGDVWGATCFARLLERASLEDAIRAANNAAGRNVEFRGASGLHHFLQGKITT
ncbi:MAG: carbohydrate kinase family protein [Gemmatimonadetes bacterium]|nr:carbohydrate kinase family protein [Gemmatimonadota bacterium]